MSKLFDTTSINGMSLSNRFVRSATHEALAAKDGSLINKITELAEGMVGLIISGHAFVSPEGRAGAFQAGIYSDDLIEGFKKMTESYAGAHADVKTSGLDAIGPSDIIKNKQYAGRLAKTA